MKQLNVRFQDSTEDHIEAIVKDIGFDKSKVARAAMNYGLKEIQAHINNSEKNKARGIVGVNMLRQVFDEAE